MSDLERDYFYILDFSDEVTDKGELVVMTARTVKPAAELEDKRTIEKFEIERRYRESHHVDWGIITGLDIPDYVVRNIEWVHKEFIMKMFLT